MNFSSHCHLSPICPCTCSAHSIITVILSYTDWHFAQACSFNLACMRSYMYPYIHTRGWSRCYNSLTSTSFKEWLLSVLHWTLAMDHSLHAELHMHFYCIFSYNKWTLIHLHQLSALFSVSDVLNALNKTLSPTSNLIYLFGKAFLSLKSRERFLEFAYP